MAAYFWRCVIGFSLAFAVALAVLLVLTFSLSTAAGLGIALLGLISIPVTFVCGSFVLARTAERKCHAASSIHAALHAILSEAGRFSLAILAMSLNPRERPMTVARTTAKSRPVLLIHGFLCNRAVWRPLGTRLRASGFGPILAVDLEPLFADIDFHARHLESVAVAMQRTCDGARVTIIAHSMGGLVARSLLRSVGNGVISRLVTIACPHHGSQFVRGLTWPATRQMYPESTWLLALNTFQERHFTVPVASIYSREDNLVAPLSAQLPGAQMRELRGVGHVGMLSSRLSLDCIMAVLLQEGTA